LQVRQSAGAAAGHATDGAAHATDGDAEVDKDAEDFEKPSASCVLLVGATLRGRLFSYASKRARTRRAPTSWRVSNSTPTTAREFRLRSNRVASRMRPAPRRPIFCARVLARWDVRCINS
jgi:hypothetical protein